MATQQSPSATFPDRAVSQDPSSRAGLVWLSTFARYVWADWRIGAAAAIGSAATWGLLAAWWMPRGPLTNSQAVWTMIFSFIVGAFAGLVSRSRWSMLVVPAVFVLLFELARLGTDGPTVDGIQFSTYGMIAFAVGRGFHGLLALAPMVLGAAIGAGTARRYNRQAIREEQRGNRAWLYVRRGVAALVSITMITLLVMVARSASTAAIVSPGGEELPNSIAELTSVDINGHSLSMMIRGHNTDNPVLLFLASGPGGSELGAMRNHLPELEEYFVVVTWDQRGAGKSYSELDPVSTITLENSIDDTITVTNYLRERFSQDQIYLLGQSWGSILGVLAAQQRPDLYSAYIGTGQMVSPLQTDRIFYEDTLAWAKETGNSGLVDTLTGIGPPPYDQMLNYESALSYELEVYPYDHSGNSEGEGQFSENLFVEEYSLVESVHALGAFMDTFYVLYPQIQHIDFRDDATTIEIPVFFVQGAHEAPGRAILADEWIAMVDAPAKELAVLETSGHRPLFEQPDEFVDFMVDTVLAHADSRD